MVGTHRSVQTNVDVPVQVQELLEYVQHFRHLRENDNFGSFIVEIFEQLRKSLELSTVVLDLVLVRKEQNVGVLQRLAYCLVKHQLLMHECFQGSTFLVLRVDFGWNELDGLCNAFWNNNLEILNDLFHLRCSLHRRDDQVFQCATILIRYGQHVTLAF